MIELLLFVVVALGLLKIGTDVLAYLQPKAEPVPVPVEQRRRR